MFKTEIETIKKQQRKDYKHGVRFLCLGLIAGFPSLYHALSGQPLPVEQAWYTQVLYWTNTVLNLCSIFYFFKVYMGVRKIQNINIVDELNEKYKEDLPNLPQSDKEIFMFYNPQKEKEL